MQLKLANYAIVKWYHKEMEWELGSTTYNRRIMCEFLLATEQ